MSSSRICRSISASGVPSTFAQSMGAAFAARSEIFTVALRFARIRFAEGDDADDVLTTRERDEEDPAFDFPKRADSDFPVVMPAILPCQPWSVEQTQRGRERQSALLLVLGVFGRLVRQWRTVSLTYSYKGLDQLRSFSIRSAFRW